MAVKQAMPLVHRKRAYYSVEMPLSDPRTPESEDLEKAKGGPADWRPGPALISSSNMTAATVHRYSSAFSSTHFNSQENRRNLESYRRSGGRGKHKSHSLSSGY
jgi:hypothetical protein